MFILGVEGALLLLSVICPGFFKTHIVDDPTLILLNNIDENHNNIIPSQYSLFFERVLKLYRSSHLLRYRFLVLQRGAVVFLDTHHQHGKHNEIMCIARHNRKLECTELPFFNENSNNENNSSSSSDCRVIVCLSSGISSDTFAYIDYSPLRDIFVTGVLLSSTTTSYLHSISHVSSPLVVLFSFFLFFLFHLFYFI
jgi:hypothetical protein